MNEIIVWHFKNNITNENIKNNPPSNILVKSVWAKPSMKIKKQKQY